MPNRHCGRRFKKCIAGERGFTLIEIMVAIVLLAFLLIAIVPVFTAGLSQASVVRIKSIASNIARERMEQVRELDYRDITEASLNEKFGGEVIPDDRRNLTFNVEFDVVPEEDDGSGEPREVTAMVSWAGPPPGETSISTLIHQQFVGPRGARLEVIPDNLDDPFTVFPMITKDSHIRYYLAEVDWGLVFGDISQPAATILDTCVTFTFYAENGAQVQLLDDDGDHLLYACDAGGSPLYLNWQTNAEGALTSVWFEYDLADFVAYNEITGQNESRLPDGYWELRAVAYSTRGEPGNVWPLQVRMENGTYGGPAQPSNFVAYSVVDNQTVVLYWTGGPELDRAYYVLQRSLDQTTWEDVDRDPGDPSYPNVDPNATRFIDYGSVGAQLDPFGPSIDDPAIPNHYYYRLRPADICTPANWAVDYIYAETELPSADAIEMPSTEPAPEPDPSLRYTVTVQNGTSDPKPYLVELWSEETNLWTDYGEVKKNKTLVLSDLKAGSYHVYASLVGGTPDDGVYWSVTFPNAGSGVVFTILD